jgi:hypothetical protein
MMEFWGQLDDLRAAVLTGERETAGQVFGELTALCRIGNSGGDGARLDLLRTIAQIGGIPFPEEAAGPLAAPGFGAGELARAMRHPYHDLPFWGGAARLGQVQVEPALAVPIREQEAEGVVDFVVRTDAFAALAHAETETLEIGTIYGCLTQARREVNAARSAEGLVAYECYLDLISRRLGLLGLRKLHSLLDGVRFEAALRRDPSLPFTLLGAALSRFRAGEGGRGYTLLRRLAASGYPEGKQAQHLLTVCVRREAQA